MGHDPITIRHAVPGDVEAIVDFGRAHVPQHYEPILGVAAAQAQVDRWWTPDYLSPGIDRSEVLLAESAGELVGVAQFGIYEGDPVIWKLYIDRKRRSQGIGRALLDAVMAAVPDEARRVLVEHFAGNARAGAFYERAGFAYLRTDPSITGDPAGDQVWRVRELAPSATA